MKIAIIGSGNVGGTLGRGWIKCGHQVTFAVRDPNSNKIRALLQAIGNKARSARISDAIPGADAVVLATPWPSARKAIESAGDLKGKVLIDCTNPLKEDLTGLAIGHTTSAAEQIAKWATGARVVKGFNTTGSRNMANPIYGSEKITMFLCGDDIRAKKIAAGLAEDIGFEVCDTGPLLAARYLEPLAMLWIHMAYTADLGQDIAFKLLRRNKR